MSLTTGSKRKSRLTRIISVVALLAVAGAGFFAVNAEAAQRTGTSRLTVGLVNEDLSAEFNNQEYAFGAAFVDLISKDSEYNWMVLSRPVAEKAYKDGSLDAVIYLPQSFSQNILTLQDTDPTKATVEYKLRPQLDDYSARFLEGSVVEVVHGFNRSVIKMYYASLANNIAGAEGHMNAALSEQTELVTNLATAVQDPFSETMPRFEDFISSASGLKDVNAANVDAQNSLITSVIEALDGNSEALSAKLPEIEELTNRQTAIDLVNAANSNTAIDAQATSDRGFYGGQYDELRTRVACELNGLDLADDAAACANPDATIPPNLSGRLTDLNTRVSDYNTFATGIYDSINQAIPRLYELAVQPHILADPDASADLYAQILALESIRDSLAPGAGHLPSEYFAPSLTDLTASHDSILNRVQSASLETNAVTNIEVKDWSAYSPDATELYVDGSSGLQGSLSDLIAQTADTSGKIAGGAGEVPDNSSQFDSLLEDARSTHGSAQNVLNGVNSLLETGNTGLSKNQQYFESFSTVLANTRAQGVDTDKIYDFFSAPIDTRNITAEQPGIVQAIDWKWVIIFTAGLLLGVLATVFARTFRKKNS